MPKSAVRALEYAALLVALSLIVATSPIDYFWGQVAEIPAFNLTSEQPGIELAAFVTMDEGTEFTPPCQARFELSATNEGSAAATLHLWTLVAEWNGDFPPVVLGDDDDSADSAERGADDDDSSADDDDSAADDDDSAADDDDSAADDDDSAADDDDSVADDDDSVADDDDSAADDDDSVADDDDSAAADDDDSAGGSEPTDEEVIQTVLPAGETVSIGLFMDVSCEDAPFRVLVFAESEGDVSVTFTGRLEVTTSDFAGADSTFSCTPTEHILEGMSIDFL
jgi:hypothetical protein